MNDLRPFVTLATALADWRAEIVFVGGWAHRLFRLDGRALANPGFDPIFTRDADVAFDDRATLEGDIRRALLNAGFKEAFFGEERPPVTHYALGTELGGFYAEFLTEQRGSGIKRDGGADATLVRAGIVAQKLRHLDLLMVAPWEVNIPEGVGDAAEKIDGLRVPNPVTFIAQKVLIHNARRRQRKGPQDVLYIHDTIQLFGDRLDEMAAIWHGDLAPTLSDIDRSAVTHGVKTMFGSVTDDLREAAQIPQGRGLNANEMREVCEIVLNEIFGTQGA